MVKINTFFAEWWSGPTSADRKGQSTEATVATHQYLYYISASQFL
jgi:hypothetical protein